MSEVRSCEDKMTREERDLVERFRKAMDREYVLEQVAPERAAEFRYNRVVRGYDENVTSLGIKRWAVVNDDLNPLWFDEDYARRTRWHGPIAPPLFILAIDDGVMPAAWLSAFLYDRNWVINTKDYPNFVGGLQGNTEIEFFEPVRPGDVIRTKSKCTECFWKQGRTYRLLFTAGETRYTNQEGRVVAVCRQGAVYRFK